jgi:hypothetical protein
MGLNLEPVAASPNASFASRSTGFAAMSQPSLLASRGNSQPAMTVSSALGHWREAPAFSNSSRISLSSAMRSLVAVCAADDWFKDEAAGLYRTPFGLLQSGPPDCGADAVPRLDVSGAAVADPGSAARKEVPDVSRGHW